MTLIFSTSRPSIRVPVASSDAQGPLSAETVMLRPGRTVGVNTPGNTSRTFFDGLGRVVATERDLRQDGLGGNPLDNFLNTTVFKSVTLIRCAMRCQMVWGSFVQLVWGIEVVSDDAFIREERKGRGKYVQVLLIISVLAICMSMIFFDTILRGYYLMRILYNSSAAQGDPRGNGLPFVIKLMPADENPPVQSIPLYLKRKIEEEFRPALLEDYRRVGWGYYVFRFSGLDPHYRTYSLIRVYQGGDYRVVRKWDKFLG